MLGSFHTAKSVLEGTNYARSLKAILILAQATKSFKWEAFMENTDTTKYAGFLTNIKILQETLSKKDRILVKTFTVSVQIPQKNSD